jgi:hypothetical protein
VTPTITPHEAMQIMQQAKDANPKIEGLHPEGQQHRDQIAAEAQALLQIVVFFNAMSRAGQRAAVNWLQDVYGDEWEG